mmetsp:Transcript_4578/g.12748  ORF Transcript_4578/g.12748 Transcript_4578/m.12748 type:complete len:134 (+) Transcript_4578:200-601(+)
MAEFVTHKGSCHCKAVCFEVDAEPDVVAWDCNCSICKMKKNTHLIVPSSRFRLLSGADTVTLYQFGTRQAKHLFCSVCGVQSYYIPRSNPDGVAVTVACLDPATLKSVTIKTFDGDNWEEFYGKSDIKECSKA